jgi:hypothetical protein
MARKDPEPCREFRHIDGRKHACHRPGGHRGGHHADSGLAWGRNPHARHTRMTDSPCPDCEALDGEAGPMRVRPAKATARR